MTVELYAYRYSVYSWIARLTLGEKGVDHDYTEVNPFAADMPDAYLSRHPFRRVPALIHDGFALYETTAITRYVDETFAGPALQPADSRSRARMAQIVAVVDAYGYWPMVRQVYAHRVFRPLTGQSVDDNEVRAGLIAAERVVAALESLTATGGFLVGDRLSLADLHLAPMMGFFTAAEEGAAVLARYKALSAWWESIQKRSVLITTRPPSPR